MKWKLVLMRYIKANGRKGYEVDKVNRHVLESGLTFAEAKERRNELFARTRSKFNARPEVAIIAERGGPAMKRAVLIIVILAVLLMAGQVQAGKVSSTVLTAERAADALRAAAVYIDETGNEPLDVEVYDPDGQDGLWLVVVTE